MQLLLASFAIKAYCRLVFSLVNICKTTNNSQCEYFEKEYSSGNLIFTYNMGIGFVYKVSGNVFLTFVRF